MIKKILLSAILLLQSCAYNTLDDFTPALDDKAKETENLDGSDIGLEYFECKDYSKLYWKSIIINLIADYENNSGSVIVSGVEYDAYYSVEGIQRIWFFGFSENEKPAYAIVLKPNGLAFYLNMSRYDDVDKINSSDMFECRLE
jgi:hypothetical protein